MNPKNRTFWTFQNAEQFKNRRSKWSMRTNITSWVTFIPNLRVFFRSHTFYFFYPFSMEPQIRIFFGIPWASSSQRNVFLVQKHLAMLKRRRISISCEWRSTFFPLRSKKTNKNKNVGRVRNQKSSLIKMKGQNFGSFSWDLYSEQGLTIVNFPSSLFNHVLDVQTNIAMRTWRNDEIGNNTNLFLRFLAGNFHSAGRSRPKWER